jgi:uncharacterized protein with LGFP repeats
VALAAAALFLWSAQAALASPDARDFERRLAGVQAVAGKAGGHAGEGPVTHRSAVVAAQASFDAVGLAGELRPLELRARPAGGRWSEWIEVGGGDPLYAVGGADEAQLRTRGWRPRGRLHFVAIDGSAPGGAGGGRAAKRGVARAEMISRRGWGANGQCEPRTNPSYGSVRAIAVHHTVTDNGYSRADARDIVLAICRYHKYGNGWNDIGYNALVDRFGRLFEGRAGGRFRPVIGAHAQGYNSQSAGIAVIGNHTDVEPSGDAVGGLARYLAYRLDRLGFRAEGNTTLRSGGGESNRYPAGTKVRVGRIFRHRAVGITACPGDGVARRLDALRRKVARRMGN